MRKMLAVWLILCLPFYLYAQYNFGIANDNYSGIQGARINPAVTAGSPIKWEFNVFSAGVLYDNTFIYTPKGSVPAFGFKSLYNGIIQNQHFNTRYDPSNPGKLYQFTMSTEVVGPSFRFNMGTNQSIGFTIAARSYENMHNLPGTTAQNAYAYMMEPDLWNKPLSDHSSQLDGMGWLEYELDYSIVLLNDGRNKVKAGVVLKDLEGVIAAYVKNTHLNYSIRDTTNLQFTHSSVDYGRTDYDSYREINSFNDLNHGHGFGADAGIVFVHKDDPNDPIPYDYRLGLSVMDIGSINFDRGAAAYHLQTDSANFPAWRQVHLNTNVAVDKSLSAVFYHGDSTRSKTAGHFKMAMPTAISFQSDFRLSTHYFLNATLVKGLAHGEHAGVVQPDLYSVTPRYESPWFEVSMPLSLLYYGKWRPRVGLAMRFGWFFIGGDAPFPMLGASDMQGADVYVGLRIYALK